MTQEHGQHKTNASAESNKQLPPITTSTLGLSALQAVTFGTED